MLCGRSGLQPSQILRLIWVDLLLSSPTSVRLNVALSQAGQRDGCSWLRNELDAIGGTRPVRPGVHDRAGRPVLHDGVTAAVEVMRSADTCERLEGHL